MVRPPIIEPIVTKKISLLNEKPTLREWFFLEGKHHGNTRISEMSDSEKERFISTLEKMLSLEIGKTLHNKE